MKRDKQRRVCALQDGRRVKYYLKKRDRDPCYLVVFRTPSRRVRERSTLEQNKKRAEDAAIAIIRDEYADRSIGPAQPYTWDEAIPRMVTAMTAHNLRQRTIDDYLMVLTVLRKVFPGSRGPADITEDKARHFKHIRMQAEKSAFTVAGNLNKLRCIWKKWLVKNCKVVRENPWEDVEKPKRDKLDPRFITREEQKAFFDWLTARWNGWRLPLLFLEVKATIGCRVTELAALSPDQLQDGRIAFTPTISKGRKARKNKLPPELFEELRRMGQGQKYVFERFSQELRDIHRHRRRGGCVATTLEFAPKRLVRWLQKQLTTYLEEDVNRAHFTLHNFRGTAMSRAIEEGATIDEGSVAFGCHPDTMRKHYVKVNEQKVADEVMDRIQRAGSASGRLASR